MMRISRRIPRLEWATGLVLLAVACGGGHLSPPGDALEDGSDGMAYDHSRDPGKDKGGGDPARLQWPEARLVVPGARTPALAIAGGTVLLAYTRADQELVLRAGPVDGSEVVLSTRDEPGAGVTRYAPPRIAADPGARQAVVLWSFGEADLRTAWWRDGALEAPDTSIIDLRGLPLLAWEPARSLSVAWSSSGPLAVIDSIEPSVQVMNPDGTLGPSQKARDVVYAFPIPEPSDPPLPWPDATVELADYPGGYYMGYGESPTIVPLAMRAEWGPGPAALVVAPFQKWAVEGTGTRPLGPAWAVARLVPGSAGREGCWLQPVARGNMDLPDPEGKAWIQIHPLGPDHGVLTYCRPEGDTAVYDIFMQRYVLGTDGVPAVEGGFVNVSETFGWTDHSEYPVVLPAGDGRFWVAWRESEFGPRVALHDAQLNRVGIAAPEVELHQDPSDAVAAAVDATGALHLAAVVFPRSSQIGDGDPEVRYWVIERP